MLKNTKGSRCGGSMYTIIVYDIGEKRVGKVLKVMRTYSNWIQNSVFEGELTPSQLLTLKDKLRSIMDEAEDSLIVFTMRERRWVTKSVMGKEKNAVDNII